MNKVSVIIPVFGVEDYIEQCVRSLFEQTLDDIEFIFIDDCTSDNSIIILEQVIEEYPKRKDCVKVIHNMENLGPAISRRKGIEMATGDYIICCDGDDWVDKDWCKKLYNKAYFDNLDICICDYCMAVNGQIGTQVHCFINSEPLLVSLLRCHITGSVWNKMVRRHLYLADDFIWPTESFSEDFACCVQLAVKAESVGYIPEALYYYRRHQNSIVAGRSIDLIKKKYEQNISNTRIVETTLLNFGLMTKYKEAYTVTQLKAKNYIRPYLKDRSMLTLWRNTFIGLGVDIWQSRYITIRMRVAYIFTYLGIYSFFIRKK